MKIKDLTQSISTILASKQVKGSSSNGVTFKERLAEASLRLENSIQVGSPIPSGGEPKVMPNPVSSVPSSSGLFRVHGLDPTRSQFIETTTSILNLLEQYQKAIANPEISLKKIDPFIQALSQEVSQLNGLSEKLSPSDPLQKILTELGIVSTVEIEKFNRGDYI